MLKKLFVHEWKDSWKLMGLFNVILIGMTVIGVLGLISGDWIDMDNPYITMAVVSYVIIYYAAILALGFIVYIYFAIRFYRNFYTDEGYLMHTLPVKPRDLIFSKALVAFIWEIIALIVICFSIFSIFYSAAVKFIGDISIWEGLQELISEPGVVTMFVLGILMLITGIISQIFQGYLAVSIGQLVKKHKILASIGVYVGISMIVQIVVSFAVIPLSTLRVSGDEAMEYTIAVSLITIVLTTAISAVYYLISEYVMKNKLNLE